MRVCSVVANAIERVGKSRMRRWIGMDESCLSQDDIFPKSWFPTIAPNRESDYKQ